MLGMGAYPDGSRLETLAPAGGVSQVALMVKTKKNKTKQKTSSASEGDVRDTGSIPGSGRSPGGRHGNPLQCSCLENPTDRGAWRATVPKVAKSQTRPKPT